MGGMAPSAVKFGDIYRQNRINPKAAKLYFSSAFGQAFPLAIVALTNMESCHVDLIGKR